MWRWEWEEETGRARLMLAGRTLDAKSLIGDQAALKTLAKKHGDGETAKPARDEKGGDLEMERPLLLAS